MAVLLHLKRSISGCLRRCQQQLSVVRSVQLIATAAAAEAAADVEAFGDARGMQHGRPHAAHAAASGVRMAPGIAAMRPASATVLARAALVRADCLCS